MTSPSGDSVTVRLTVNGQAHSLDVMRDVPLLYVLRDQLGLNGAKYGCGLGQCGACTVVVDGRAVFSCVTPARILEGKAITTIEGLGTHREPGPIQQAFIDEQAAQCGYCIPGMMMRAKSLLDAVPQPSTAEIKRAMQPNLCRCGTHMRIIRAVQKAAELMHSASGREGAL